MTLYKFNDFDRLFFAEKPTVGIFGNFQIGKSTFINCLLENYAAIIGNGLSTTSLNTVYKYGLYNYYSYKTVSGNVIPLTFWDLSNDDFVKKINKNSIFHINAEIKCDFLKYCNLADTPGFNANDKDTETAIKALDSMQYILYVITNKGLSTVDKDCICELYKKNIPISVIMNCNYRQGIDSWFPDNEKNQFIAKQTEAWLREMGIKTFDILNSSVYVCNFLFYMVSLPFFINGYTDIYDSEASIKQIEKAFELSGRNLNEIKSISKFSELFDELLKKLKTYHPINKV